MTKSNGPLQLDFSSKTDVKLLGPNPNCGPVPFLGYPLSIINNLPISHENLIFMILLFTIKLDYNEFKY